MNTIFIEKGDIIDWSDQIIEKLITVCLLDGKDAEQEFTKGRQIVQKVAQELQGLSINDKEKLNQAIDQILTQRLPDLKVINNFSGFYDIKDRMINEGIETALFDLNKEELLPVEEINRISSNSGEDYSKTFEQADSAEVLGQTITLLETIEMEEVKKTEIIGIAKNNKPPQIEFSYTEKVPDQSQVLMGIKAQEKVQGRDDRSVKEKLQTILKELFPSTAIHWDLPLAGNIFLAQVNNLLIHLGENRPCKNEKQLLNQNWLIIYLAEEDLAYLRRTKRQIRQIKYLVPSSN